MLKQVAVVVISASMTMLILGPLARPAAADLLPATVSGSPCAGGTDVLSWPPSNAAGLAGYRAVYRHDSYPVYEQTLFDVPANQTNASVTLTSGLGSYLIYTLSSGGASSIPFASVFSPGLQTPQPIQWDDLGPNTTGDGTVTVTFGWPAPSLLFDEGWTSDVAVTVTASPGGATIMSTPQGSSGEGVTDTFSGLANGVAYTFTSVATNQCGSSSAALSPEFTPAGAPPPLTTTTVPTITCNVTGLSPGPPAQQQVTLQASAGLASITKVKIVNGTVNVAPFGAGTTGPVVLTATKKDQSKDTTWHFLAHDTLGNTRACG